MKDIFIPVLLLLGAIGGIAWWSTRGEFFHGAATASVATAPAPEPKPAAARANPAKRKSPSPPVPEPEPETAAEVIPAAIIVPQAAPVPPPPFPAVQEIASGVQEEHILERYGDPVLSTTTSDHDHVFETLIYARDQGQLQTVIRVEDGKVLTVYSQTMPPPVQPLSSRPVRH